MSDVIAEVPAAGWYQDPNDDNAMRWWDGSGWTDHTQPIAPEPAPSPVVAATRTATTEGSAGGAWVSNYTEDELALYTGKPTELTSGATTGRTMLEFTGTVPDWRRDRVTAQTPAAWLLAVSPLLWAIFSVFWTMLAVPAGMPAIPWWIALPALIVLTVLFAALDARALRQRGVSAPSVAFILLSPLAYLIARAVVVRRSGASGIGPLVMNILSSALLGAFLALAVMGALVLASGGPGASAMTSRSVETTIEGDLSAKGTPADVDCSAAAGSIGPNSSFHCIATAADGAKQDLLVTLDDRNRMKYQATGAAPAATPAAATAP